MDLRGGPPREPSRDGPPGGREHSAQLRTLQLFHVVSTCVALVTVYANKLDDLLDRKQLAELCAHAEHCIGTEGRAHLEQTQEEDLRYKVIVETEKQRKALQAAAESGKQEGVQGVWGFKYTGPLKPCKFTM
eukprot:Em0001g1703a